MDPRPLKLIFMGTPIFAVPALKALMDAGHDICAVYTQPPRPAGRGHKLQLSPVHSYAKLADIPVFTPINFKSDQDCQIFTDHQADLAIVVAYGLILRSRVLQAPKYGCYNIHASLLPRWRGAAPIQRAILAGDQSSGITIMRMDRGMDTGDIIMQDALPITQYTTQQLLHDQLSALGAQLIVSTLKNLQNNSVRYQQQPAHGVTYASKLNRMEGLLDWRDSAELLERKVRALNPWPGSFFVHDGEMIKILQAEVIATNTDVHNNQPAGCIIDDQFTIACGSHALRPTILQRPGKSILKVDAFLRGLHLPAGTQLTLPIISKDSASAVTMQSTRTNATL